MRKLLLAALLTAAPLASASAQYITPIQSGDCTSGQFVTGYASPTGARHCGAATTTPPAGGNGAIQYSFGGAFAGAVITGLVLGNGSVAPSAYAGTTGSAHQFITALSASGVGTFVRPVCGDLSDAGAGCTGSGTTSPSGGNYAIQYSSSGAFAGAIISGLVLGSGSTSPPSAYTGTFGSAHQFMTALSGAGSGTFVRPVCSDLSDAGAGCSSAAVTVKGVAGIGWVAGANPDKAIIFTASSSMTITAIRGTVDTAVGTAATIQPYKASSGSACSGGTALTTTTFNANGTALTNQNLTLAGSGAPSMVADDRVCLSVSSGTAFTGGSGIGGITVEYTVP